MQCPTCGVAVTQQTGFATSANPDDKLLCSACFIALAMQQRQLTSDERARLKAAVKDEMAGVLPRGPLQEHLEDGYGALLKGDDFDEVIRRTLNKIDQAAGLAMCQEVLGVIGALQATLREQEETIRDKIKKLSAL